MRRPRLSCLRWARMVLARWDWLRVSRLSCRTGALRGRRSLRDSYWASRWCSRRSQASGSYNRVLPVQRVAMILAGDVGGTKVHLALYNFAGGRLQPVRDHKFPASGFATLDDVVNAFLT